MEKERILIKGHIVYPDHVSEKPEVVVIDGGFIASVGEGPEASELDGFKVFDCESAYICPGFVDLHVHGAGGADVMDGTPEALSRLGQVLAQGGTTSFLATTMAAPQEDLIRVLTNVARYMEQEARQKPRGARLVGSHLEGPFLNEKMKGAQKGEFLRRPDVAELKTYLQAAAGTLKMLTLAPELANAVDIIKYAKLQGLVVSLGHSDASPEQVKAATAAGLSHATHMFNAMGGFHHRQPGTAGSVLSLDNLTADIIPDGLHVHPDVIKILIKTKGEDMVCAVTDCIRAGQMPDGDYELGGNIVHVRKGAARHTDDTIAGSTLSMSGAVRVLVESVGLSVPRAVNIAFANPARVLGLDAKGRLTAGGDADLVILDRRFAVLMTVVGGEVVFNSNRQSSACR